MQTRNNKKLENIKPVSLEDPSLTFCHCASDDDVIDAMRYCFNDVFTMNSYAVNIPDMIYKVIFNKPATIILWKDGTKTVVKRTNDDIWDPEKGFCMAVIKKLCGHTSFIKKFTEQDV